MAVLSPRLSKVFGAGSTQQLRRGKRLNAWAHNMFIVDASIDAISVYIMMHDSVRWNVVVDSDPLIGSSRTHSCHSSLVVSSAHTPLCAYLYPVTRVSRPHSAICTSTGPPRLY
uniref:Cytochrome P450 n=1 Tax=Mesocestoides corti TaxID=53468 RepID=A0A5K3FTN1_MESCO